MSQTAKDAVELIEYLEDNLDRAIPNQLVGKIIILTYGETQKIIAGLELLRGVAEGTHVIVKKAELEAIGNLSRASTYRTLGESKDNLSAVYDHYRAMITENE